MPAYLRLVAGLVSLFLFVACGDSREDPTAAVPRSPTPEVEATEEEEVLTLLYWQAPSLPSPYLSGGFKDRDAGAVTLEPLAKYDPEGNLVPALAAEIPTPENGGFAEDLMSITWKLKEGLRWSDGSDLTADDVVFTWRYCVDGETGCTSESSFDGIASVEAVDNLSVKVTFEAPTPYPYSAFVSTGVPVISRAQFGECIGAAAATCDAQNTAPLGTGPYRIIDFKVNDQAVYERNPFYRGETPYFDRVVLKGGGDADSAARTVLENGKADYGWNLQVEPEVLAEMEELGRGKVVSAFASLVERIVVNQTNPDHELGEDRSEYLDGQNPHPFLSFRASVFFGGDPVDDKEASYRRFFADVQMYASETGIDPQESLSDLLCKHIPTREDNWSLGNIARACNPEYDSLFAKLEQTGIGQEREVLVKQLNDIHVQSYVEIPLVNRGYVSAHLNTLKGVRINGWDSELWNIAEWRR